MHRLRYNSRFTTVYKKRRRSIVNPNYVPVTTGFRLWFDASEKQSVIRSGGAVSRWNDKSGNGNNATQGMGSVQPTFIPSGFAGKGAVSFIGAAAPFMTLDSVISGPNITIFAVFENTESVAAGHIFASSSTNNQVLRFDPDFTANGTFFTSDGTTQGRFDLTSSIMDVPTIFSAEYEIGVAQRLYIDGELKLTTSYDGTIEGNQIGKLTTIVAELGGNIGEILIYNRILKATERTAVNRYLSPKWSTTLA